MKKFGLITLMICLSLILLGVGIYYFTTKPAAKTFYLNAYDENSYMIFHKLSNVLKKEGVNAIVSDRDHFQSGKFNIYASENEDDLPQVLDKNAINFLWVPKVKQDTPEPLRPFDVIVVRSAASFSHLKAINVRTAYIPEAFDVTSKKSNNPKSKLMFYGDNDKGFSLSLYLAGPTDLKIDVFGKGFEGFWGYDEIMKEPVKEENFREYALALADQSEEDIRDELINTQIIKIIENGGVPYVRYNQGVYRIFGDYLPMYHSETEFLPLIKKLLAHPEKVRSYRDKIREIAKDWDTRSQAKKFIELFEVMEKKMIAKN